MLCSGCLIAFHSLNAFLFVLEQLFIYLSVNFNIVIKCMLGFPGGAVVENLPANAGDIGSSSGLGRSHMPWSN